MNILFVVTDQQRGDALGAVSPWMHTPSFDRIAAEGVLFRRCVTQSPGCIPARVALMTGLYPHNTGVWHNRGFSLPPTARNWVRAIHDAGHYVCVVGKLHLHPHSGDVRHRQQLVREWGFDDVTETTGPRASAHTRSDMTDEWETLGLWDAYRADIAAREGPGRFDVRPSPLGLEHHYDSYVGRKSLEALRQFKSDRPWFLWVGFGGPHEPWDAPAPFAGLHRPEQGPPPRPPIVSVSADRPQGLLLDGRLAADARQLGNLSAVALAAVRANYADKVSLIDSQIAALIAAVEQRGELDRTLIVLTSDHGEMNGDFGLMHKSCFLDPAVTVPLLVRCPGSAAPRGQAVDSPVELIDVGPTLAEAAGAHLDYHQWGRSLWPILRGDTDRVRDLAISEQRGEILAVGEGWKVAFNRGGAPYLCTDLIEDPHETVNLAGSQTAAPIESRARARLFERLLSTQLFDDWF